MMDECPQCRDHGRTERHADHTVPVPYPGRLAILKRAADAPVDSAERERLLVLAVPLGLAKDREEIYRALLVAHDATASGMVEAGRQELIDLIKAEIQLQKGKTDDEAQ